MTAFDTSRVVWRKSTRSGANSGGGGSCVEVGALPEPTRLTWRKSSRSAGANGGSQCVEVGATPHLIGIRDSKLGDASPQLWLAPSDFTGLLTQLRADAG